jgi:hypothetical protein
MNDERSFERTARAWLELGANQAPDRTVQSVLLAIETTPQERDLRIPWRFPTMNTPLRVGMAAVIGLLVLGAGFYLIGGREASIVGTEPTPTLSPSPAPTVVPSPSPETVTGELLPPGTYTTANFRPAITYTVPAGWTMATDDADGFALSASVVPGEVSVCKNPRASIDAQTPVNGVGADAKSLAEFHGQRSDLRVISPPVAWSQGGLEGYWLDISGLDNDTEIFTFIGGTCGPLNLYSPQRQRIGFLDVPDGSTLMVVIDAGMGRNENVIEAGTTVVESFTFTEP